LAARWISAVCLGLLSSLSASADTWTNRAGHVLTARLVAIQGEHLILQHANGRTWRLPLSSLKPADQQRAREQTGTEPLPSELRALLNQAEEDIQRAAQFLQGGKITREEYEARCQQIRQRFEHLARQALKDRGQQSDLAILDRLKQRLDPAVLTPTRPDSTRLNPTNPIPNLTL
jgi:hypothetical protein